MNALHFIRILAQPQSSLGILANSWWPCCSANTQGQRLSVSDIPKTGFMERVIHQGEQGTLHPSRPGGGDHSHWEPSYLGESQWGPAFPANDWASALALHVGLPCGQLWSCHLYAWLKVSCDPHLYVHSNFNNFWLISGLVKGTHIDKHRALDRWLEMWTLELGCPIYWFAGSATYVSSASFFTSLSLCFIACEMGPLQGPASWSCVSGKADKDLTCQGPGARDTRLRRTLDLISSPLMSDLIRWLKWSCFYSDEWSHSLT